MSTSSSSERMLAASLTVHDGEDTHANYRLATGARVQPGPSGTEQRPKHIGRRPHALPPTAVPQVPVDRDSTRVLALPGTGRFAVVFSRNPDGVRPKSITVSSQSIAQTFAGEHKARKVICAFVAWLANLMPRQTPPGPAYKLGVARSGVRARPGSGGGR